MRITRNIRIMRLRYGPDVYWMARLARIGHSIVSATRIVGRWYIVRVWAD